MNSSHVFAIPTQRRAIAIFALLTFEVLAMAAIYQVMVPFECGQTDAYETCRFLRSMVARALSVIAVGSLLVAARRSAFTLFTASAARPGPRAGWALALHLTGLVLLLTPAALTLRAEMSSFFGTAALLWVIGSAIAAVGGLLWLAPLATWRRLGSDLGWMAAVALAAAPIIPDAANAALPLWDLSPLTRATYSAVHILLGLFGSEPYADAQTYIIGVDDFYVHIARQCSGVEGIAMVTGLTLVYALLMRDTIRFTRYWSVVLPLGLMLSWLLNVVRIVTLVLIGAHVSPDLAVDGFHSHAGWLFFTMLAMAMLYVVHATAWLHRAPVTPHPTLNLREDWIAAAIIPFVVFMLSGVFTDALLTTPELGYPLRAVAMALALAFFWPSYRRLAWSINPLALTLGALVGVGWLAVQPGTSESGATLAQALAGLSTGVLFLWIGARMVGTILLVPIIEELFFRGYLLHRLDRGGPIWRIVALGVTSALFALLHGRWLEAGVAGLVFGLLALRRGRVSDAIVAHATANAVIALAALYHGDWGLI